MSIERLKTMKDAFMCAVEGQMYNLTEVDAEELGEVVDMIKDLSEAIYYCEVVKAMEGSDQQKIDGMMYYTPTYSDEYMRGGRMYYGDGTGRNSGGHNSSSSGNGNSTSQYSEREFPNAFQDKREGRSYRSRRMYMESKETKQDKSIQMKELEKYAQELTQDVVEMIDDASPEERMYLSKKITALANKLTQLNDQH